MDHYAITSQVILDKISRHCPTALSTYFHCINRANEAGKVSFSRVFVEEELSETWTKFKNNIKKLALEDLLEWHTHDDGINIVLAAQDDDQ